MDETQSGGLVTRMVAWVKKPFNTDMDAFHWFLFFGLIIIISFLWSRVLFYINKGIEA
jgi:hypothetical protein